MYKYYYFFISLLLLVLFSGCEEEEATSISIEKPTFKLTKNLYYIGNDTLRFANISYDLEREIIAFLRFPSGREDYVPINTDGEGPYIGTKNLEAGNYQMRLQYLGLEDNLEAVSDWERFTIGLPNLNLTSSNQPIFRNDYFDVADSIELSGTDLLNQSWKQEPFGNGAEFVLFYGALEAREYFAPFQPTSISDESIVIKFNSETGNLIFGTQREIYLRIDAFDGEEVFERIGSVIFLPPAKLKSSSIEQSSPRLEIDIPRGGLSSTDYLLKLNDIIVEKEPTISFLSTAPVTRLTWDLPETFGAGEYEVSLTIDGFETVFYEGNTLQIVE